MNSTNVLRHSHKIAIWKECLLRAHLQVQCSTLMFTILAMENNAMVCRISETIGAQIQIYQVLHEHVQQRLIFKRRYRQLSLLQLHKQDSSDFPIRRNRGSINREIRIAKRLVQHINADNCCRTVWRSFYQKCFKLPKRDS